MILAYLIELGAVMTLAYIAVVVIGVVLILSGSIYLLARKTLNSDPVLIVSCYACGSVMLGSCMIGFV